MSKTLRALLVIGGVLMALVIVGLLAHGSRSRPTLQAYKAQLRAKGEKLTLSELKPNAHANINNSLALLNNAVTKLGNARFFPVGLMTFIGAGKACLARTADQPPFDSRVPGNPMEWTEFVAVLEKAEPALEEIRSVQIRLPVHNCADSSRRRPEQLRSALVRYAWTAEAISPMRPSW